MDEPLETSELLAFSKTVEAGSLSRAAAELGVPRCSPTATTPLSSRTQKTTLTPLWWLTTATVLSPQG
jgi:hypothetical protein